MKGRESIDHKTTSQLESFVKLWGKLSLSWHEICVLHCNEKKNVQKFAFFLFSFDLVLLHFDTSSYNLQSIAVWDDRSIW